MEAKTLQDHIAKIAILMDDQYDYFFSRLKKIIFKKDRVTMVEPSGFRTAFDQ